MGSPPHMNTSHLPQFFNFGNSPNSQHTPTIAEKMRNVHQQTIQHLNTLESLTVSNSYPTGSTSNSPNVNLSAKRKRSWSRAVFSQLQRKGLEIQFQIQKYITKPDRRKLAARLGLTDAQVQQKLQLKKKTYSTAICRQINNTHVSFSSSYQFRLGQGLVPEPTNEMASHPRESHESREMRGGDE